MRLPFLHCVGNHCVKDLPRADLLASLRAHLRAAPAISSEGGTFQFPAGPRWARALLRGLGLGGGHHDIDDGPPSLHRPPPPPLSPPFAPALDGGGSSYFAVPAPSRWRLLVLDTTDLSFMPGAWPVGSPKHAEAAAYAASRPLSPERPHMLPWNGGLSAEQMSWLKGQLASAEAAGDRVLVAAHHPLARGSARETHLAWDWREVSDLLDASPAVAAAFAGHDHLGGYYCLPSADSDSRLNSANPEGSRSRSGGTHFLTLPAVLEAREGGRAHAVVEVHGDKLVVVGEGDVGSRTLRLKPWPGRPMPGPGERRSVDV